MVGMTIVACGDKHLGGANLLQDRDQADGGGLLFLSQPAIADPEKPRSMRTDPEQVERGDLFAAAELGKLGRIEYVPVGERAVGQHHHRHVDPKSALSGDGSSAAQDIVIGMRGHHQRGATEVAVVGYDPAAGSAAPSLILHPRPPSV